jgi:hypothetical protein
MITYLLASLPTPQFGAAPITPPEALVLACGDLLAPAQLADLRSAAGIAGGATDPHTAAGRAWADLEAQVVDAVTRERAERLRSDPAPELLRPQGYRADIRVRVAAAFAAADPAARERALLALRWSLADDLAAAAPDGFAALLARAAQTAIAARLAGWDAEAGWRAFEGMLTRWETSA